MVSLSVIGEAAHAAGPQQVNISVSGSNGSGVTEPGIPCASGGDGASWRYNYSAALTPGDFSQQPGTLSLALDLHSEGFEDLAANAWLPPGTNAATITNARGTATLAMTSGTCDSPTISFDGSTASGTGVWSVGGTGAYRDMTGGGTFALNQAQVGPGSTNPFQLNLSGSVAVPSPVLDVEVARAAWTRSPDPRTHRALVEYRVLNVGPGDAFGVRVAGNSSPTPGVTPVTALPVQVPDIPAGGSAIVELHYDIAKPCKAGCPIETELSINFADALDVPDVFAKSLSLRVPG